MGFFGDVFKSLKSTVGHLKDRLPTVIGEKMPLLTSLVDTLPIPGGSKVKGILKAALSKAGTTLRTGGSFKDALKSGLGAGAR